MGRPAEADGGLLADYEFELPPGLIAQHPLEQRDASRLLHLPAGGAARDLTFSDLPDLLRATHPEIALPSGLPSPVPAASPAASTP